MTNLSPPPSLRPSLIHSKRKKVRKSRARNDEGSKIGRAIASEPRRGEKIQAKTRTETDDVDFQNDEYSKSNKKN